jgi:hypothetical protein
MTDNGHDQLLPLVERIQAIRVEPGDIVVAHVHEATTPMEAAQLKNALLDLFPVPVAIVVIASDVANPLTVYRPAGFSYTPPGDSPG